MSGIFPNATDGGLAPNALDTNNPKSAYAPIAAQPISNSALYYGNGCDVRLRPEVVNSLISEIEATCDEARVAYDYSKLDNLETAVRYLIQRGLARSSLAVPIDAGNLDYILTLLPKCTGPNNFMSLIIIPSVTNLGAVRLNADSTNFFPLLRNDSSPVRAGDLKVNIPVLIAFWQNTWYAVNRLPSQVPARTLFNIFQQSTNVRTVFSNVLGFVPFWNGSYVKLSGTSDLSIRMHTNVFSDSPPTGNAASTMRARFIVPGGTTQKLDIIIHHSNIPLSSSAGNGEGVFKGIAAGNIDWNIEIGRADAVYWYSVVNPRGPTDAPWVPPETATYMTFSESESS
jgi:hypothetical protein